MKNAPRALDAGDFLDDEEWPMQAESKRQKHDPPQEQTVVKEKLPRGIRKHGNKFRVQTRDLVTNEQKYRSFKTLEEAKTAKAAERAKQAKHKLRKKEQKQNEVRALKEELPIGIHKDGNKFGIKTRDLVTSEQKSRYFNTLEEAKTAKAAERAKWAENKRQRAERPQEEIRAENLERHGNACQQERDVAIAFHAADGSVIVLNDSVLADMCAFFYANLPTKALGIQLKTTRSHEKGKPNTWHFNSVTGYTGLIVVCWRIDKQDGYAFAGDVLNKRKTEDLLITPGGKNAKLALSGVEPLGMNAMIAFLKSELVTGDRERFPPRTQEYFSWQFSGRKAYKQLKERIGIHLYQKYIDPLATFPQGQNGSHDLDAGDPNDELGRKQFKTALKVSRANGFYVHLCECAGRVGGVETYRPYIVGVFDEVVVFYFDWPANLAHVWRIPASKVKEKGHLHTETQAGHHGFSVYKSTEFEDENGDVQWTAKPEYYKGTQPIGNFPDEAEAAAGHMLRDLREGIVA